MRRIVNILVVVGWLASGAPGEAAAIADPWETGELVVATREDAIAYVMAEGSDPGGFEHDLVVELARTLDLRARFVVYPDSTLAMEAVRVGEVHLAAAGLAHNPRLPLSWSAPLRELDYVLVGRSDSAGVDDETALDGRSISARSGTLQTQALSDLRRRRPAVELDISHRESDQYLLDRLAAGDLDLVATDRAHFALAAQIHPQLDIKHALQLKSAIAWALPMNDHSGLGEKVADFLGEAASNGLIARMADRYFAHVRRIDEADVAMFLERMDERLPRYRAHFLEAQTETDIDWRYLAALAYQESHWDPLARSRTGVRGMMMLTSETADSLGVSDRLNARESILGGARYLAKLRDALPEEISEPDRTWIATAAYNLGMGHMNGARAIARGLDKDDASWWDLKSVLPLMSRPAYAARLKSGPARGGEAVVMTENVRNYYGMLVRLAPALDGQPDRSSVGLRP